MAGDAALAMGLSSCPCCNNSPGVCCEDDKDTDEEEVDEAEDSWSCGGAESAF